MQRRRTLLVGLAVAAVLAATFAAAAAAALPPALPAIIGLHGYSGDVRVETSLDKYAVYRVGDGWVVVFYFADNDSGWAKVWVNGRLVYAGTIMPGMIADVYSIPCKPCRQITG